MKSRGPLLAHLDEIEARCLKGDLTLQEILEVFGVEGHHIITLFLILPFLQPIPLLGLTTPFGISIAIIGVFGYLGKPPWLPKKWVAMRVPSKTVGRIAEGAERVFEKLGFILHPRWLVFFGKGFRTVNVILLVASSMFLALPLPVPFSNVIPAWTILFQALAHLEEDGLLIVFSYVQSLLSIVLLFLISKGKCLNSFIIFLQLNAPQVHFIVHSSSYICGE